MSLYGNHGKICGVKCAMVMRGSVNGEYLVLFERKNASLEQIEAINWSAPELEGGCGLPAGYGFEVEEITYSSRNSCWRVTLRTGRQYLGDVSGYLVQLDALNQASAAKDEEIAQLQQQLDEADEAVIDLYEQLEAAAGEEEQG